RRRGCAEEGPVEGAAAPERVREARRRLGLLEEDDRQSQLGGAQGGGAAGDAAADHDHIGGFGPGLLLWVVGPGGGARGLGGWGWGLGGGVGGSCQRIPGSGLNGLSERIRAHLERFAKRLRHPGTRPHPNPLPEGEGIRAPTNSLTALEWVGGLTSTSASLLA